jgi:HK97 family phage major capsid protein
VTRSLWVTYEPPDYRFTGLSGPSFVRDLSLLRDSGSKEAAEAKERLRRFERWSADVAFAPVTTTSASEILPPGYRQAVTIEMTADRPLAAACENQEIQNAAPFTVPRATGDDTVDAARAEGDQPADGDPTFDSEAVTPVGLSGQIVLTRELVDSASPGGDLIALQIMREDWYRQVEIRVYDALNTAASGTITAGFVPSGAQARVSSTPATNLYSDLRKALAFYSNARRRKARNVIAGADALDHLAGLITFENGDDTALWRVLGARVNGA